MSRKWFVALLIPILVALSTTAVLAQEAAAEAPAEGGSPLAGLDLMDIMFGSFFNASQFIPLFIISIAAMALVIDFLYNIRRDKFMPPEIVGEIEALLDEEEYEEALDLCDAEPNYFTRVIGAGIPKVEEGFDSVKAAMADAQGTETAKYMMRISWLSLCASLGPMFGLLGTVSGMVAAFSVIAMKDEPPKPAELAGGIQTALITTVLGLYISIPCTGFFFFLKNKITKLAMEAGGVFEGMIERFKAKG